MTLYVVFMPPQEILGHRGDQGARQEVGGQHGKNDRFGEWDEQVARHAGEKEHGNEDNADGERGDKGRRGDLLRAVEDGVFDLLTHVNVPVHVFDFHRCVIDENSNGQRQATQGHDVDGFAQGAENEDRSEDGEGNGDGDDDRASPTPQEEKNHQAGEARGDHGLFHDAPNGAAHKDRLIAQKTDIQGRGQSQLDLGKHLLNPRDDIERRIGARFLDRQEGGALSIHADNVGLGGEPVAYIRNVTDVDGRRSDRFYRDAVQLGNGLRSAVYDIDVIFLQADFGCACGQDQVLRGDGVDDVQGGKSLRLQSGGV